MYLRPRDLELNVTYTRDRSDRLHHNHPVESEWKLALPSPPPASHLSSSLGKTVGPLLGHYRAAGLLKSLHTLCSVTSYRILRTP